jgi:arsenate reductase
MKKVLFICVHNAARSQMAEGFFNHLVKNSAQAVSAGTSPGYKINTAAIELMKQSGIDISRQNPKLLTTDMLKNADRVVTMGCGIEKVCPAIFVESEDWGLDDPEGKPIQKVREIRDEIRDKVELLIKTL